MKKQLIILILVLLSSFTLKAQYSNPPHAQPDSVIKIVPFGNGENTSYVYTIGGKIQTPEEVRMKLLAYAPSADEYHKAKSNSTWAIISIGGLALSTGAAVIEYATHNKNAGATATDVNGEAGFNYQHHSLTGAYIFTGVASAFLVSSIINYLSYKKHASKALKLYNQRFE